VNRETPDSLSRQEKALIESLVGVYERHEVQVRLFRDQLVLALSGSPALGPLVHSLRSRLKEPEHLRDKLIRKVLKCRSDNVPFEITAENLLVRVNDLVGVRILHLYTRQIRAIDVALRAILQESTYELVEGPFARTWDDESRQFFIDCGITPQGSPSLYTSVHYIVGSASRTRITAEIQVRTLMEEVWGEVDHTINYPHPTSSVACAEQLKVLARVTSSATRLVDSIFVTFDDHVSQQTRVPDNVRKTAPTREAVRVATRTRRKR
jgi:putative GTP pyrophosphokinase